MNEMTITPLWTVEERLASLNIITASVFLFHTPFKLTSPDSYLGSPTIFERGPRGSLHHLLHLWQFTARGCRGSPRHSRESIRGGALVDPFRQEARCPAAKGSLLILTSY